MIRHSLPEIDPNVPAREWRLGDEGRERARLLSARLKPDRPALVVSSVEPKAWETAAVVAQRLDRPCVAWPDLHEHERATVPFTDQESFTRSVEELFARPDEVVFGEESAAEAGRRFERAVRAVLKRHGDEDLAIVAHGTVISLLLGKWCGVEPRELWRRLGLPGYTVVALPERRMVEVVESVTGS